MQISREPARRIELRLDQQLRLYPVQSRSLNKLASFINFFNCYLAFERLVIISRRNWKQVHQHLALF